MGARLSQALCGQAGQIAGRQPAKRNVPVRSRNKTGLRTGTLYRERITSDVFAALEGLHAKVMAQNALADADALRRHFQKLVRLQKLKALFQAEFGNRHKAQRIVAARGAGVGEVLCFAHVYGDVFARRAVAHHHAFIHLVARVHNQRAALLRVLKAFPVEISGKRPIAEAIITTGGVSVREVSPKTMESKKLPHLYFAGEVLDVDAYTGGFNLQIAWSTGRLAGLSAAEEES